MSEAPPRRRVALLDLYARADGFVSDDSMAPIAARLQRDGHEARLLRSVLAEDTGGDLSRWHEKLGEFLRDQGFDLIVLPRAWDRSTLDAIRAAAPAARLVRLTSGVAARLDEHFDLVLNFNGFLHLLGGEDSPAPAQWTRMTPRELREVEERRLQLLPRPSVAETRYEALPGVAGAGKRPTITGPAAGCPFLLDARQVAIYKDLAVDDEQVQMKGCTFCLDNVGTYTTPSVDAMVGQWIEQLRDIRRQRPHTPGTPGAKPLEVLCTDERPHPYLPALFRAIAADPAIGPIELLIKSRVDWLLEFADSPMSEALVEARASKSLLHVYLVGFESFDQFHLDLFNKGVTVEENVRAIETLRALHARFPDTFEYLRHRAHGIVLFTPWTTPDHLLENARRMREVRFHELRSEALKTRLRLYPRVPLHALAARDGLLVDAFDEGRGDRAAEQGYDASVPWRFRDARVEAIFRVANAPELRRRGYADADVLEAATRFVLRWPGLAEAPDLATLPFEQALRIWSPPPGSEGAPSIGFDPEVDGIRAGLKLACLKEGVARAQAERLIAAYRAMGFAAAIVWAHGLSDRGDVHGEGDEFVIVAVARDEDTLARVLEAQRAHRARDPEAPRVMGELMGYPACCTAAFLAQHERGDNLENERATFRRAPTEALHPLLNRFAVVRLASHHLCTPSCAPSLALAESLLARLADQDPRAADWVRDQLAMPVLVPDYNARIGLRGAWEGDTFRVDAATSLDDPRRLPAPIAGLARVAVAPAAVTFEYEGGRRIVLDVKAPILATPGAPLAPPALAAIGAGDDPRESAPPPLPDAVRPGAQVLGYRILSIRPVSDGRAPAHEVELGQGAERIVLRLRAHDPARTQALRRGAWAIDVKSTTEPLPERARAALVLLARALPA